MADLFLDNLTDIIHSGLHFSSSAAAQ
jgi:hypothetical protein